MSDADNAFKLLRGEISAEQYWHESGQQQVRSAGVLLTQQQQVRICKNLTRMAEAIRRQVLESPVFDSPLDLNQHAVGACDNQYAFDDYLATLR